MYVWMSACEVHTYACVWCLVVCYCVTSRDAMHACMRACMHVWIYASMHLGICVFMYRNVMFACWYV